MCNSTWARSTYAGFRRTASSCCGTKSSPPARMARLTPTFRIATASSRGLLVRGGVRIRSKATPFSTPMPESCSRGSGMRLDAKESDHISRLIRDRLPDQLKLAFALSTRHAVRRLIEAEYGTVLPIRTAGGCISNALGLYPPTNSARRASKLVGRGIPPVRRPRRGRKRRNSLARQDRHAAGCVAAFGAHEAVRPTHIEQDIATLGFDPIANQEGWQRDAELKLDCIPHHDN